MPIVFSRAVGPGDLPVFLPTKRELVINLTTALGFEVSLAMMVRADELLG